ncbi:MAG: thioredoxin fold domain-containing protein [Pseudomonadota bacterium]
MSMLRNAVFSVLALIGVTLCAQAALVDEVPDGPALDDQALDEVVRYPDWFQLSFLNLREDLQQALRYKKRGLIVYFGQHDCPYCYALIEKNLRLPDIESYTRRYFDVVAVDIHGMESVVDMNGEEMSEQELADSLGVDFTPTLIFYDAEGKEAMRLRGYYPPYKFRAALEYMADAHYREESFRDYLERADPPMAFEQGGLNEAEFFSAPPYALDRSRLPAEQPLAVFFEQGDCHACDILHTSPLGNAEILEQLTGFESVQLDIWADTPVLTPGGERTTSRAWAQKLGLFYTPSVIFFDELGKEIIRVDSVVGFYRLRKVLDYISSGTYKRGIPLLRYRRSSSGEQ